jgi:hypothetical protein
VRRDHLRDRRTPRLAVSQGFAGASSGRNTFRHQPGRLVPESCPSWQARSRSSGTPLRSNSLRACAITARPAGLSRPRRPPRMHARQSGRLRARRPMARRLIPRPLRTVRTARETARSRRTTRAAYRASRRPPQCR